MTALAPEQVAALMPCHRVPPSVGLLEGVLAEVGSLLVVDDGMAGEPAAELDRLAAGLGFAVLRLRRNLGKGHALAAGLDALRRAGPAAVLALDADGQHPPAAIPAFLAAAARGELVVGDRFAAGADDMPIVRHASNRLSSRLVSLATANRVPDSQCGMRLLHGRALRTVPFPSGGMESETRHLVACLRAAVPVAWVPIPAIYEGQPTSFRRVRDSLAVLHAALASS